MFKTYINTFLRKFRKEKLFSLLNLGGLTVGLTTVLLIGLYIQDELSFDRFHAKSKEIYLLYQQTGERLAKSDRVPFRLADKLAEEVPEIDQAVHLQFRPLLVSTNENAFVNNNVAYSTPELFEIFDFPLLFGDKKKLEEPTSAYLTKEMAEKFFGDATLALGKDITVNEADVYTVQGVLADLPSNSTVQFDFLLPGEELFKKNSDRLDGQRGYFPTQNWLLINEDINKELLSEKMEAVAKDMPFYSIFEYTKKDKNFFVLPLESYHLEAGLDYTTAKKSDIRYVYLFMAIGVLVLIIAVINYTNLATAQSIKRAKEVGLRKVIGASRNQVIAYYLTESFALVFISAILAFAITERLIPLANNLLDKELTLDYFSSLFFIIIFGATIFIGLLAGIYPAFILSSAKPLQALTEAKSKSKNGFRKVLIITQFFIAQLLIIATVLIQQQLRFIQNKNLGYEREHLIEINMYDKALNKEQSFKNQLKNLSGVENVSLVRSTLSYNDISFLTKDDIGVEEDKEIVFDFFSGDQDFVSTMGMELVMGENIKDGENDMVITESAYEAFGWDGFEGRKVNMMGDVFTVVGVIKDFHNESLKAQVRPAGITSWNNQVQFALVRLSPLTMKETITQLEELWNAMETGRPFEYKFLDEAYEAQYRAEMNLGSLFLFFAGLAIFIAVLGLVGLSTFTIEQRLKEISLRRVLGATYNQLFQLFAKSYVGMILIGFMLAAPIVYYLANDWLAQFVYRIEPGVGTFGLAVVATMSISLTIILLQVVKTKRISPAENLRNE